MYMAVKAASNYSKIIWLKGKYTLYLIMKIL